MLNSFKLSTAIILFLFQMTSYFKIDDVHIVGMVLAGTLARCVSKINSLKCIKAPLGNRCKFKVCLLMYTFTAIC